MAITFQSAFQEALAGSNHSIQSIAEATGITEERLTKISQSTTASVDLQDAQKVSGFFGATLADFLQAPELSGPIEITDLYNQLPEHLKAQFRVYQPKPTASLNPVDPE